MAAVMNLYNHKAEQHILGAILLDKKAVVKAKSVVEPDDFHSSSHRVIFNTILSLHKAGSDIDVITISDSLKRDRKLKSAGGASYISGLANAVPNSANISTHLKMVRDLSVKRETERRLRTAIEHNRAGDREKVVAEIQWCRRTLIQSSDWPEPIQINDTDMLPDCPVHLLPEPGRVMVEAVADVVQVDPALPFSLYIGALSASVNKKAMVNLVSHKEPLAIYMLSILPSAERKSQTFLQMMKPLYDKQAEMKKAYMSEQSFKSSKRQILELQKKSIERQAAKSKGENVDDLAAELSVIEQEIGELSVKMPILFTDDTTIESLAVVLAEQGERQFIASPEGGIFSIIAGRYSDKGGAYFDLLLKAHTGEPYTVQRIGRDTISLDKPLLTICITAQPGVLSEVGTNQAFIDRGLISRFLYTICKPQAGRRKRHGRCIPEDISERYRIHLGKMIDITSSEHELRLTRQAHEAWDEFHDEIEQRLGPGEDLADLHGWGGKLAGAAARISGLLHFGEYGRGALERDIGTDTVMAASEIARYYAEHALNAFGMMRRDSRIEAARRILEYIENRNIMSFQAREILQNKNHFNKVSEIEPGLEALIERGYIRKAVNDERGGISKGRPRAQDYLVNPKLLMKQERLQ